MNNKPLHAFSLFCLAGLFLPASGAAQCKDQLCRNLQNILDAAVTDFREYRANRIAVPDVSVAGAKVPCQMTAWANNVPMLICYVQIPYQGAQGWYAGALESLRILEPAWQFKIDSPAADHFFRRWPTGLCGSRHRRTLSRPLPLAFASHKTKRWHGESLSLDKFVLLALLGQPPAWSSQENRSRPGSGRLRRFVPEPQASLRGPRERF